MLIAPSVLGLPLWVVIAAGAGVAAIVRDQWLERQARGVVERWATQHGYRLVSCRRGYFATFALINVAPRYAHGVEHRRHVYAFGIIVDDRKLGGVSRGKVQVRGDWLGGFEEDVEVAWDALNEPDPTASPPGPSWDAAQLALLRRIADGETTFRPDDGHTAEAGERFDRLVEHLQAMQRRGLVEFPAPLAELRRPGRQYAAVTQVALTAAGRDVLARVA